VFGVSKSHNTRVKPIFQTAFDRLSHLTLLSRESTRTLNAMVVDYDFIQCQSMADHVTWLCKAQAAESPGVIWQTIVAANMKLYYQPYHHSMLQSRAYTGTCIRLDAWSFLRPHVSAALSSRSLARRLSIDEAENRSPFSGLVRVHWPVSRGEVLADVREDSGRAGNHRSRRRRQ
jgi:hypothetical protein